VDALPGGQVLMECAVRPTDVVMADALGKDQRQVPLAGEQHSI
jgi:hypothetical protein